MLGHAGPETGKWHKRTQIESTLQNLKRNLSSKTKSIENWSNGRRNVGIYVRPSNRLDYSQRNNRIISTGNRINPVFSGMMTKGVLLQILRFETPSFNVHKPRPRTTTLRIRKFSLQEVKFSNRRPHGQQQQPFLHYRSLSKIECVTSTN